MSPHKRCRQCAACRSVPLTACQPRPETVSCDWKISAASDIAVLHRKQLCSVELTHPVAVSHRQWGAAVYMMCDVPPGSLGVQPVDGAFPTGAPMALLSPTNYLTFGGTGSGTQLHRRQCSNT